MSTIGAIVLMLVGLGLGIIAVSVRYMGSFSGSGLAGPDALFVTIAALASAGCIIASIAMFASASMRAKS